MFHTMYECCSEAGSLWSKLDYVGITLLILASNYPTVHLMFYCKPLLVWLHLGIVRERYLFYGWGSDVNRPKLHSSIREW